MKQLFIERHDRRGYYDFVKMVLGVLVSIIVLVLFLYDALEKFEQTTFDYRMKFRGKRDASESIVLIDMGEDSVDAIGRWPWPREWHATMISVLSEFGAKAIVFDVIFSESSSEFNDSAMEEAMKKFGNVYIPYAINLEKYDMAKKRWGVRNIILPLERFSKWAKGEGHITLVPDSDGTIRRVPLVVDYKGEVYPQLGLRVGCDIKGLDPAEYKVIKVPFGRYIKIGEDEKNTIYLPVDTSNQMLVNWVSRWGEDFKHYSYIDVITSYQRQLAGKEPIVNLNEFKDKICVIGLTAAGLYDIKPNPLQPAYPAVGTNANVINSVLNEDFIKRAPPWLNGFIIIILGVFLTLNISKVKPLRGAITAILIIIAYMLISFAVLDIMNTWLTLIYPLIIIIFAYFIVTFYNLVVISTERAKLFTLATKDGLTGLYVIRHFNLLLEAEITRVAALGGRLSVLMLDIDHFKDINDTYGHTVGDLILREIGGIVISSCRQLDIPSRYGGEEFIVMLPGANISDANMAGERIRKKVEEHNFKMDNKTYKATISIGIAAYKDEETRDHFVKRADKALYQAKLEGRNKVCISEVI